ncbi:hypothetical protein M595_4896 [Lyngbya aestuarii BL J]|uniref:Uncharacterized protein n=2 Tax=Lyngbya aestuarii TaxID=118322 RepID=U7QFC1_9CYAN|nr:hypothetical protein [Lyngbya aestuarii]ERT05146.1 hypothetical protein M595_4896 [Lyngbya aestuarii BL J]
MIQVVILSVIFHPVRLLYSITALGLTAIFVWSLQRAFRDGIIHLKRLHSIPCSRCTYFTGDYRLKCTVHPKIALTEEALECGDYESCGDKKLRLQAVYSSSCDAVNIVHDFQRPCR